MKYETPWYRKGRLQKYLRQNNRNVRICQTQRFRFLFTRSKSWLAECPVVKYRLNTVLFHKVLGQRIQIPTHQDIVIKLHKCHLRRQTTHVSLILRCASREMRSYKPSTGPAKLSNKCRHSNFQQSNVLIASHLRRSLQLPSADLRTLPAND